MFRKQEELLKMRGRRSEDGTYDGYVSRIPGTRSMAPKYIAIAREAEEAREHAQLGGAMLGVGYTSERTGSASASHPHTTSREKGAPRYQSTCPPKT